MEIVGLMRSIGRLPSRDFWSGKRVFLTGQTGFKGSWCALWLEMLGAEVTAFALAPNSHNNLYDMAKVNSSCNSLKADINDAEAIKKAIEFAKPQIVIHMAAQALVKQSFVDPVGTWNTNVGGTLNLLEALRGQESLDAALIVTTDKVYANDGSGRAFVETDPLGGKDPYSASKAACEIAVASHAMNYFHGVPLATARGGNVIGGGDFSNDRLAPDCVRATLSNQPVVLRQPNSTRPWQHVLDCLCGYLLFVEGLVADKNCPRALNIGPETTHELPVLKFAESLLFALKASNLLDIQEEINSIEAPKLGLNTQLARKSLNWSDRLSGEEAISATAAWYQAWNAGNDMRAQTRNEIISYESMKQR